MGHPFQPGPEHTEKVPVDKPPSYGREHGVGDGASWKMCYHEEPEERRKRRSIVTQQSIDEKAKIAVDKTKVKTKEELPGAISAAVTDAVVSLIPALWDFTKNNPNARPEDFAHPSFVGNNSVNTRAPTPAQATAKGPAPVHSSPTSVSCMVGGPSSLAELDALTVITCHTLFTSMSIVFCFSCLSVV